MPSGGARPRSGPAPTPGSARSDARGLSFKNLPAEGYTGDEPEFPLPKMLRYRWEYEDKRRFQVLDLDMTEAFRDAELALWSWAWRTPQAALWATAQWSWAMPSIADWCRLKALSGEEGAPIGVWSAIRQREGDILLSRDALLKAGYTVATDEVAEKRSRSAGPANPVSARERAKRLRAVGDA